MASTGYELVLGIGEVDRGVGKIFTNCSRVRLGLSNRELVQSHTLVAGDLLSSCQSKDNAMLLDGKSTHSTNDVSNLATGVQVSD